MKKLVSLVLAVLLVLALAVPAMADKIAPVEGSKHTYTAYQIFSGTQTDDADDATLGAVAWGDGIDDEKFLEALKASEAFGKPNPFTDCDSAAKVADVMKDWSDSSDYAKAFAKLAENYIKGNGIPCENGITTLDAGYYLVVDTTEKIEDSDAYNIALLQLTKKSTFEITAKNSVPEVVKKVSDEGALKCTSTEEGHVHGKDCYDWADANNVALGDTVHYMIDTAVPATATEYEYYFFIVNDTLSKGLTYTAGTIAVTIGDDPATVNTDYTVKVDGQNIQVALVDAISHAGEAVVVTYDATVNTSAMVGVAGNPNKVTVDFSNNPNEDWDGSDIPSDGFPAKDEHKPKGHTPEDDVITYVSKINIYKVDGDNNPLKGAEFTLTGDTLNQTLVMTEKFTADVNGTYYKLTDGTYTEEAPTTADEMKKAEAGATAGYVIDSAATGDKAVTIGNTTYRPYDPATDTGKDIYILVKANKDAYVANEDATYTKYKREWVFETQTASGDAKKAVGKVDDDGVASFEGLPAGTYTISETVIPAGYNPIPDITFTTTWSAPEEVTTGEETCTWAVDKNDKSGVEYNADKDAFEITVVNQKGTTLPETGGIGTTIFYAAGSILLLGAAILLITRKRVKNI